MPSIGRGSYVYIYVCIYVYIYTYIYTYRIFILHLGVFTIERTLDPNHRTIPTHWFITDRTTPTPTPPVDPGTISPSIRNPQPPPPQISADKVTPVSAAVTPEPYPHLCHSGFHHHPLPARFSMPTQDPPHPVLRICTRRTVSDDIEVLHRMRRRRHGVQIHTATPQLNHYRGTCHNDPSVPSTANTPPLTPST
jgi:hypothetical protein